MLSIEERKKHILESANQLLAQKGLHDITLDEVAKQACFSKGGITHYYKNKDQLLVELSNMLDANYLFKINSAVEECSEQKCGSWTRALIAVSNEDLRGEHGLNNALVAGAMASRKVGNDSKSFHEIQKHVTSDGYDPVLGTIIRLALDGMYYAELFHAEPLDENLRSSVIDRMNSWTLNEDKENKTEVI